jgi:hypothetical protein
MHRAKCEAFLGVEVGKMMTIQSYDHHEKAGIFAMRQANRNNLTICPKITIFCGTGQSFRVRFTPVATSEWKKLRVAEERLFV